MTEKDITFEPRKRVLPEHPATISALTATLTEDKRKVRICVELSHNDTHPDLDLVLYDSLGDVISHSTIIELFGPVINFTMHIRKDEPEAPLTLKCRLSYLEDQVHSEMEVSVQ